MKKQGNVTHTAHDDNGKYTCNKCTNWKFQQKNKNIKKSQVKIPKLKNSLSKIKFTGQV